MLNRGGQGFGVKDFGVRIGIYGSGFEVLGFVT